MVARVVGLRTKHSMQEQELMKGKERLSIHRYRVVMNPIIPISPFFSNGTEDNISAISEAGDSKT